MSDERPIDPLQPTHLFDEKAVQRARAIIDAPPEQIGPYRIIERIGGGGMGEVYRAEQRSPIRREVALKFIKLGMDTKAVIARFEAERQALALMDHPHIAKVLDAGTDDTGRPFFVMEYVKGKPITDYADKQQLTIAERLELMEQVCQAIQHAHHKGVIHRDLKPTNVLVSTHDGKPFAKVIDFGIAKAIGQQLTDKTLFTLHDQFIGTPQYMSPEQAEGSLDIDTRTDVYSLGVLMYELLTGTPPFSTAELKQAAWDQFRKRIMEVDPPKPSTRLSESGEVLATLATSRRTEPKRLGSLVRGELDWIVMKALEKDRKRRYETPMGLASDIKRHLEGEPVQAAPPSRMYQLQKFAVRNKALVRTVGAVGMALLLGIVGLAYGINKAHLAEQAAKASEQQTKLANGELQVARNQAEALANSERAAKELALRREAESASVLRFVQEHILSAAQPIGEWGGLGVDITLRDALFSAIPAIDTNFINQPLVEARVRATLSKAFHTLGEYSVSAPQIEKARSIFLQYHGEEHFETLDASFYLAIAYGSLGDIDKQLAIYERLREIYARRKHEDISSYLDVSLNIASAYSLIGQHTNSDTILMEVIEHRELLYGESHDSLILPLLHVALKHLRTKEYEASRSIANRALQISVQNSNKRGANEVKLLLAQIYDAMGDKATSIDCFIEVIAFRKEVLGTSHPDTLYAMHRLSSLYEAIGEMSKKHKIDIEIASAERIIEANYAKNVSASVRLANNFLRDNRRMDAIRVLENAVYTLKEKEFNHDIIQVWRRLISELEAEVMDFTVAKSLCDFVRFVESHNVQDEDQYLLRNRAGISLMKIGQTKKALEIYSSGIEKFEASGESPSESYLGLRINYAGLLRDFKKWDEALAADRTTFELSRQAYDEHVYISDSLRGVLRTMEYAGWNDGFLANIDQCIFYSMRNPLRSDQVQEVIQLRFKHSLSQRNFAECLRSMDLWRSQGVNTGISDLVNSDMEFQLSEYWRALDDPEAQNIADAYELTAVNRIVNAISSNRFSIAEFNTAGNFYSVSFHPDLAKYFQPPLPLSSEATDAESSIHKEVADLLKEQRNEAALSLCAFAAEETTDEMLLLKIAALQAWFGRDQDLVVTRRTASKLTYEGLPATTYERVSKVLTFCRNPDESQLEMARTLAELAVQQEPDHPFIAYFHLAKGLSKYRKQQFEEALKEFDLVTSDAVDTSNLFITTGYFRAMAYANLGRIREAKVWQSRLEKVMRPLPLATDNPLANGNADDVIAWLASRECNMLLEKLSPEQ